MDMNWLERTELLLGREKLDRLRNRHVLVVGLGGVGAYAAEQIARAGVGEMTIVDADNVDHSNRNRQLPALVTTVGKPKIEVMKERLLQINPELKLHAIQEFIRDEGTGELLDSAPFDYVVDAIDSLAPKVFLIYFAMQRNMKIISAMGAGGKMDPSLVQVADIKKTYQCKLAHALRKRLHRLGVRSGFKAVFSPEIVPESAVKIEADPSINKLSVVGTISYMPAIFGCFAAATVIRELVEE
ncbi:tRNA threonylcarbamoyladenosine dehydratase [Bacteroidales bacterium OttesenSCG-928-B11]|nr:tRNA threonylcarbamoyladenosine dehydratase [Bacteroidales bacterium OttesenSCG-928-E04]MDL2308704.1 tRNA threonylcarbamoyladenosine dehydratase [Bacteroidales bacterium OttesenSCG-928-C03]MDL2311941.1 tRNA threonylcarbamoyladenosine dehydratase [Bacteroidales bacterium OttesenSCG-928-B11]